MKRYEQSGLIQSAGELWRDATHATFLDAVANGTLPDEAFRRWMEQDYHFATGLTQFQSIMASKTPRPAQKLVIGGLLAMDSELDWFEAHAEERGYDLQCELHPTCRQYVDFLIAAAYTESYEVLLAILFGVEVSYLSAWSALSPQWPYAECIERWSNPRFAEYVEGLYDLTVSHKHPAQQPHFNEVLKFERDFWAMTWEG